MCIGRFPVIEQRCHLMKDVPPNLFFKSVDKLMIKWTIENKLVVRYTTKTRYLTFIHLKK